MNKTKLRKTSYSEAEAGITEEKTGLRALFPYYREKDEILQEIYSNPQLESTFFCWEKERQEEFLDFCCGNRGVKVLYDTFFKIVFNPDSGRDNLIRLISVMIGSPEKGQKDCGHVQLPGYPPGHNNCLHGIIHRRVPQIP